MLCKSKATEIGMENFRGLLKIHENRESFLLQKFSCLWYIIENTVLQGDSVVFKYICGSEVAIMA